MQEYHLIIIRGNAGSGKSTVSKILRKKIGENTMYVSQDTVLREIVEGGNVSSETNKIQRPHVAKIMKLLVQYGMENGFNVIVDGILKNKHIEYNKVLHELVKKYPNAHVYFIDVPFEETVRRHATRDKSREFGADKLRKWYEPKESLLLNLPDEKVIPHTMSPDQIARLIYDDLK